MNEKERVSVFREYLRKLYPEPRCALNFTNAYELLIATMLSAQCTDRQVNIATPALFKEYPTAQKMALANLEDIERLIHSTGFYKNKAKNIIETSKALVERFSAAVPSDMEELISLRGVGRKTANVVLGNAFQIPGVVVDTHVSRISKRFGLTKNEDPDKIEQDLMKIIPKDEWIDFSHRLVLFGREVCNARKPLCDICEVSKICPSSRKDK